MTWGFRAEGVVARWASARKESHEFSINVNIEFDKSRAQSCLPILGPTGAGKSTLLYLIATLKWPETGRVCWTFPDSDRDYAWERRGKLVKKNTHLFQELRQIRFGFAFQHSTLVPHLNISENLKYPLWQIGVSERVSVKRAQETLEKIRIPSDPLVGDFLNRFPSQLSGGQKQRAALAQAWIHDPNVLFADEPTGNLDRQTRRQVMSVVDSWMNEKPEERMFVWVTHHDEDIHHKGVIRHLIVRDGAVLLV